jgi:hypothetical protein
MNEENSNHLGKEEWYRLAVERMKRIRVLETEIAGAVRYMESCGYSEAEVDEPEYQMLRSLKKALSAKETSRESD